MPKKVNKPIKKKKKNRFIITRADIYWWIEFTFFTVWILLEVYLELR